GPCKLSSAVEHITQQGVAYARHMDPDLVSAAGFKPTHDFRHGLPGFVATETQGRIMRERGFRSDRTLHRHAHRDGRITTDGQLNASGMVEPAMRQGNIFPPYATRL